MEVITLVIITWQEEVVLEYDDYSIAKKRFEDAKQLFGVQELFMTFPDGATWQWTASQSECGVRNAKCGIIESLKLLFHRHICK